MYEKKIISEINLDLAFDCNDCDHLSDKFHDPKEKLIFDSNFWENVFISWIKILSNKDDYELKKIISEKKSFSLGLQIISNQSISNINKKWMKKNGATDVLSFPIISDDSIDDLDHIELGDIFISLEKAVEQSYKYKHSVYREMIWLASHGFLHLLGWEHNDDQELDDMLSFQEYLISHLH